MQIECPQCGKTLSAEHLNHTLNIMTCDACEAVFSAPSNHSSKQRTKVKIGKDVAIPERFNVQRNVTDMQITYKQNPCFGVILGIFAVIWNGMLWTIFVPAFGFLGFSQAFTETGIEWEMLLFPVFLIPFLLIGVYLALQALAMLFNTSTVYVDSSILSIKHRPIPMPLDKNIASGDIDQIYTKRHVTRGSSGEQITYQVHVVVRNGKSKKLIEGLNKPEQGVFIEQHIEEFLGIADRYVDGEYSR